MEKLSVVEIRRKRLREWIGKKHNGVLAGFVEETGINQGELSRLLQDKSFGEKKARSIEKKAGMPAGLLDSEDDTVSAPNMPDASSEALAQIIKLSRIINRMANHLDVALNILVSDSHQQKKSGNIPAMKYEYDFTDHLDGGNVDNGQILKSKKHIIKD